MSRFFIDRPIFASVIGIVIVIAGLITLKALPIAQYPEITPPTVKVTATYPGANAQVLAETVGVPIEEQVNGVEGMIYMSSTCSSNGQYSLTVSFEVGTDIDMATVLVQNRVAIAQPGLPDAVKKIGVTTKKQSTNIVLMISMTSEDGRYDDLFLSNYISLNLKDQLARIEGVGDVYIFGVGDYSMRIWLNPEKLKARNLTTQDVVNAITEQNVQVAAGQIGQPPSPKGQNFQYTINTQGRLSDIEQFENIIIKTGEGGRILRVKDVAEVELGAMDYSVSAKIDGKPTAMTAIYQLPGANALDMADAVRAKMEELKKSFPEGLDYEIPFDTTEFVRESIDEVVETLFIAILLVFIVIFVFLQDWRATLIPAITIPVSLIGTFAFMGLLGFSINMLTLFGLVLAIGIVVDDAIVVVENTARNMEEHHMPPKEATIRAMEEVSGPIVATTLVLMAVFVPTAFLGGITGQLYRQFALTIAVSTFFSSINALTLSPALSAIILRPAKEHQNVFFRMFNSGFDKTKSVYEKISGSMVRRSVLIMVLFGVMTGLSAYGFISLPTGFLPTEDQGYVMASVQLPDAASKQRTIEISDSINKQIMSINGVENVISVNGYSLLDGTPSSNAAAFWVIFKPLEERKEKDKKMNAILAKMTGILSKVQEAAGVSFPPPAISGLGTSGGFKMQLEDRGNAGLAALQQVAQELSLAANGQTGLAKVYTTFRSNVPQLFAEIDRTKAKTMDVPLSSIFNTLQAYLGSSYVNDFNKFGKSYQVKIQAHPDFRAKVEDIQKLEVRSSTGRMVPLGTLVAVHKSLGPQNIVRFNMYPTASISGSAAPGYSSGQALDLMEQLAHASLPSTMGFDWTDMSFQEKAAGNPAVIFILSIIFVYLVLCAQYESWTISAGVILSVPLALLGTVIAVYARSMDNNIYTQIGIVLLIALASKNAILIIEFAVEARRAGKSLVDSAMEAARLRFRPILMTSFAFVLGVFPLVIASGAGAASRQALGTAVFGGMLAATCLTVLFVPVFFVVIQGFSEWAAKKRGAVPAEKADAV